MLRFRSLASGSAGNATLVEATDGLHRTRVLIDCGLGWRQLQAALARPADFCWLFSSSEAVGHLPTLAPDADWSAAHALATHPRIAEAARALGMGTVQVVAPSPEAVSEALPGQAGGVAPQARQPGSAQGPSIQSGRT